MISSSSPVISVVMAVCNGRRWLSEAIKSILSQTFRDFEFIIINDGSTDDSLSIAESFSNKDSRIIVINQSNQGLSNALNSGIRIARGEWIARLDADDIAESSRLQRQLEVVQSDPTIVLLGSGFSFIDETGNVTASFPQAGKGGNIVTNIVNGQGRLFPHSSAFFNTKCALLIGGYRYRIRRSQDKDLWLRLSRVGRIESVDEVLVRIRRHASQISHDFSGHIQMVDSHIAVISYLAVNHGLLDPADYNDEKFMNFRTWLEKRLVHYRRFEIREWQHMIQNDLDGKKIANSFYLLRQSMANPAIFFIYFKLRIFGNKLPHQLAKEWFKHSHQVHTQNY